MSKIHQPNDKFFKAAFSYKTEVRRLYKQFEIESKK